MKHIIMDTAEIQGKVYAGENVRISYGVKVDARNNPIHIGRYAMILENSIVESTEKYPIEIGQGTVFGHRCMVKGAKIGNFCEIGNGVHIGEGAVLGDYVIIGEGTYIPSGSVVESKSVILGKPFRKLRNLTEDDFSMIKSMRSIELEIKESEYLILEEKDAADKVEHFIEFRSISPKLGEGYDLADRVEIIGEVSIGSKAVISEDVKIIGDYHGSITIGDNVNIGKGTVIHLLPGNDVYVGDNVKIGERCIIHGCKIEDDVIIEDDSNICDLSTLGKAARVIKGSLVAQRTVVESGKKVEGYPVK